VYRRIMSILLDWLTGQSYKKSMTDCPVIKRIFSTNDRFAHQIVICPSIGAAQGKTS